MSAWTERMSTYDPMWYFVPYHVTTLQKLYGPIPVLPTTSDQMETKPVFLSNATGNAEQEKEQVHIRFDTRFTKQFIYYMVAKVIVL